MSGKIHNKLTDRFIKGILLSKKEEKMTDLFTYKNYRTYIKDACAERRTTQPFFSYRYIAERIGLKSTGFISWVVLGKRNISTHLIHKLTKIFKMNRKEAEFFELLVNYNQSKRPEEQQYYLEKMVSFKTVHADVIAQDRCKYYSQWYYSAIRELIALLPMADEKQIADMVRPPIKKSDAHDSLELLERLGLIKKNKKGFYERTSPALTSSPKIDPSVIHNFQFITMQLAQSAMHRFPRKERDISTVTLSCDRKSFQYICERVARMRAEIIEIACASKNPDQVFQLNTQLFPLSKQIVRKAP